MARAHQTRADPGPPEHLAHVQVFAAETLAGLRHPDRVLVRQQLYGHGWRLRVPRLRSVGQRGDGSGETMAERADRLRRPGLRQVGDGQYDTLTGTSQPGYTW